MPSNDRPRQDLLDKGGARSLGSAARKQPDPVARHGLVALIELPAARALEFVVRAGTPSPPSAFDPRPDPERTQPGPWQPRAGGDDRKEPRGERRPAMRRQD